ncbi:MAG: DnaJ domain-containing protein [Acidobacteria bacterium]|nr:DnaJ domain-containing protein [Acidobacteriota bacterium]
MPEPRSQAESETGGRRLFPLLREVAAAGRTGTLEARRGGVKSAVRIREGRLLFPSGETLTAFLVREGRLTREVATRVAATRNAGEDFLRLLIREGVLSEPEAENAAREYLDRFLRTVAAWADGEVEFREEIGGADGGAAWGSDACLRRILAVVRGLENPAAAIPLLSDPGATLQPAPPGGRPADLDLGPEEAFLLSRITPGTTVREADALGPWEPEKTRRALAVLIAAGLVSGSSRLARPTAARGTGPGKRLKRTGPIRTRTDRFKATGGGAPGPRPTPHATPSPAPPPEETADELHRRCGEMENQNHYQLLGVSPGAGADAIRRSYYDVARRFHPDKFHRRGAADLAARAESYLARVTEAYRILAHAEERARYDERLRETGRREAPQVNPDHLARQNVQRGLELLRTGQLPKALQFFQNAVELQPNNDTYLCHLAEVQVRNPRLRQEARRNLTRALRINPANAEAHIQLGMLLEREGKPEAAVREYQEALTWEPASSRAQRLLDQARSQRGTGRS